MTVVGVWLLVILALLTAAEHAEAELEDHPGRIAREKHCRADSPADDGWISQCAGKITCPSICPRCHLSCKFCGMIYCPKCNKVGSVCQDPRFIGGDGVTFYFHGEKDADFCLISDANLQVNAHFIGKRPQGRPRDFTWVQALGILFGPHKLYVASNRVSSWNAAKDQFLILLDSLPIQIEQETGKSWQQSEVLQLTRLEATNSLSIYIPGLLNATVSIVPISPEESRVHGYEITAADCFAHLEVNFQFMGLTAGVEGVLGQTYAPGWETPIRTETLGNRADLYKTSSILSTDCSVSRFRSSSSGGLAAAASDIFRTPKVLSCGSKNSYKVYGSSGFVCKK